MFSTWYNRFFKLNKARCAPIMEDHLQVSYTNLTLVDSKYQGNVSFDCDSGYILDGTGYSTCHHPGLWIPEPPKCNSKGNTKSHEVFTH